MTPGLDDGHTADGLSWHSDEFDLPPVDEPPRRYDAFVSYNHEEDNEFAPALQRGVQRVGKPWNKPPAVQVFRDETSLSANPDLWASICSAMDGSDWLVLLASPGSAKSVWVGREISRWLKTKGADRIIPVVTAGTWTWDEDEGDFPWDEPDKVTAVHPALRGAFARVPRHVDMSWVKDTDVDLTLRNATFRDHVAEVAAELHGKGKEELVGEDVRQQRRTRRLARGSVTLLAVLAILAVVGAGLALVNAREANHQRGVAVEQAREATSQRLADLSLTATGELRSLLAVQAQRMAPTPQAIGAMVAALSPDSDSSGVLGRLTDQEGGALSVGYAPDGSSVVSVDAAGTVQTFESGGGRLTSVTGLEASDAVFVTDDLVAAATPDGVALLPIDADEADTIVDLDAAVTRVAAAGDGATVLAGTESGRIVRLTVGGEVISEAGDAHDEPVRFVGASEDGTVVVSAASADDPRERPGYPEPMSVVVHEGDDLTPRSAWTSPGAVLDVSPDGSVVAVSPGTRIGTEDDGGTGTVFVQVLSASDGAEAGGVHVYETYIARDADFSDDGRALAVATTGGSDGAPGLAFLAPLDADPVETEGLDVVMGSTHAIALAPDGSATAVAGSEDSVLLVATGADPFGGPVELGGAEPSWPLSATTDGEVVVVVADAAGDGGAAQVGVADVATGEVRLLASSADAHAALSPDGSRLLTAEGVLDAETGERVGDPSLPSPSFGLPPSFSADGSRVAYVVAPAPQAAQQVAVVDVRSGELVGAGPPPDLLCGVEVSGAGERFSTCSPAESFLALSPDGTMLALRPGGVSDAAPLPNVVEVVDVTDGWESMAIATTEGPGQVSFTEDGAELFVQSGDSVVRYAAPTLEASGSGRSTDLVGRWEEEQDALAVVAECSVTLADLDTLRPVAEIPVETGPTEGGCLDRPDAAWLEGGTSLLVGTDCGGVEGCPLLRYDLDPDHLADTLCQRAGRNLTIDEWEQFLSGWDYEDTCAEWSTEPAPTTASTTAASETTDAATPDEGETEGLTIDDLLEVELPVSLDCADGAPTVQLEDGVAECNVVEPFPDTHLTWVAGLGPGEDGEPRGAVLGDLTGDGAAEGVLLTTTYRGQAGLPTPQIWVFGSDGALLTEVRNGPDLPDSLSIADGVLVIGGVSYSEDDAIVDGPSLLETVRLVWDGSEMVVASD